MPRYTDIDLLIEAVEDTDWYHISKQGELARGANSKDDIPLYKHSDIKEVLNNAPAADVVPKSEYEQLQQKYELAVAEREANVKGFTEELAKAKSVAIAEFVERLKTKEIDIYTAIGLEKAVNVVDIDKIAKEVTEEKG